MKLHKFAVGFPRCMISMFTHLQGLSRVSHRISRYTRGSPQYNDSFNFVSDKRQEAVFEVKLLYTSIRLRSLSPFSKMFEPIQEAVKVQNDWGNSFIHLYSFMSRKFSGKRPVGG